MYPYPCINCFVSCGTGFFFLGYGLVNKTRSGGIHFSLALKERTQDRDEKGQAIKALHRSANESHLRADKKRSLTHCLIGASRSRPSPALQPLPSAPHLASARAEPAPLLPLHPPPGVSLTWGIDAPEITRVTRPPHQFALLRHNSSQMCRDIIFTKYDNFSSPPITCRSILQRT